MKKYIVLLISSFALLFSLVPLGAHLNGFGGHHIKFTVALLAYSGLTYYWLQYASDSTWRYMVGGMMVFPLLLVYLPVYLNNFDSSLLSVPSTLAHVAGILLGYILTYASRPTKLVLVANLVIASIWVSVWGYDLWLHKLNFGTYSGLVNEPAPSFTMRNDQGQIQTGDSLKGQFVVLDFWTTSCGVCFRKFPRLQQYHSRYQHNPRVKFFAVNIPLEHDKPQAAQKAIQKGHYSFPVLYAQSSNLATTFKVASYPTVIVINPDQQIVYRGELEGVGNILNNLHFE